SLFYFVYEKYNSLYKLNEMKIYNIIRDLHFSLIDSVYEYKPLDLTNEKLKNISFLKDDLFKNKTKKIFFSVTSESIKIINFLLTFSFNAFVIFVFFNEEINYKTIFVLIYFTKKLENSLIISLTIYEIFPFINILKKIF
ncbi:MAG: hypothetical protein K4H23_03300, partial [Mollicutes bacterium PWAP]|nr:hypothetical protein [Mollicutes bacterium PWAP]